MRIELSGAEAQLLLLALEAMEWSPPEPEPGDPELGFEEMDRLRSKLEEAVCSRSTTHAT